MTVGAALLLYFTLRLDHTQIGSQKYLTIILHSSGVKRSSVYHHDVFHVVLLHSCQDHDDISCNVQKFKPYLQGGTFCGTVILHNSTYLVCTSFEENQFSATYLIDPASDPAEGSVKQNAAS